MPILALALGSLFLAWVRGASPLGLSALRLRLLFLPLLALAMQLLAFRVAADALAPYAIWFQCISLGMLLAFLVANVVANRRYHALTIVAAGTALNLLVITANGGYMPVRVADVERAGFPDLAARLEAAGRYQKSVPFGEQTRLPFLADIIHVPLPGPDRLLSAGDVLVALGVFAFIQQALMPASGGDGPGTAPATQSPAGPPARPRPRWRYSR